MPPTTDLRPELQIALWGLIEDITRSDLTNQELLTIVATLTAAMNRPYGETS